MTRVHRPPVHRVRVVVVLSLLGVLGGCGGSGGEGGCVRPGLRVGPAVVSAGQTVDVIGTGFFETCEDVSDNGVTGRSRPLGDGATIAIVQDDRTWVLAVVRVDPRTGGFSTKAVVPVDMKAGQAVVRVSEPAGIDAAPVTMTIGT